MAFYLPENPIMDISERISAILCQWMAARPDLNTIKKLSSRSGVGFGTVRRLKNGDGNVTIKNLELIAKAFAKRPDDLLTLPAGQTPAPPTLENKIIDLPTTLTETDPLPYRLGMLIDAARNLRDEGQLILLGRAQELALLYPRETKRNRAA
jgi:transcriptional regulator with XRE-family HTH domain